MEEWVQYWDQGINRNKVDHKPDYALYIKTQYLPIHIMILQAKGMVEVFDTGDLAIGISDNNN